MMPHYCTYPSRTPVTHSRSFFEMISVYEAGTLALHLSFYSSETICSFFFVLQEILVRLSTSDRTLCRISTGKYLVNFKLIDCFPYYALSLLFLFLHSLQAAESHRCKCCVQERYDCQKIAQIECSNLWVLILVVQVACKRVEL